MVYFPLKRALLASIALYVCLSDATPQKKSIPNSKSSSELTKDAHSLQGKQFDYIIVGAGNAGMVLANHLSQNPKNQVLVIEAGNDTRNDVNVYKANETYSFNQNSPLHSFSYPTTPQIGGSVKLEWTGKGLGGSTTVNGQAWNAPSKEQLDDFSKLGSPGWSFENMMPYYIKTQDYHPPSKELAAFGVTFEPHVHGSGGPTSLSHPNVTFSGPPQKAFVEGVWTALGVERGQDLQSGDNNGVAYVAQTLYPDTDLRRVSSATSYYSPIEGKRPNLMILLTWRAIQLQWAEQTGPYGGVPIASGVIVQNAEEGEKNTLTAKGEVILSSGSIRSPFLLEHSGVGDKAVLDKIGVTQVLDIPGVGRHLAEQSQNQIGARNKNPAWRGDGASSSIALPTAKQIFANVSDVEMYVEQNIAKWAKEQVDAGAAVSVEAMFKQYKLIAQSIFQGKTPTTEFFFGNGFWGGAQSDYSISVYALTVFSRGYTHAIDKNPWALPEVNPRSWTIPIDMDIQVASLIAAKKVFATPELLSVMKGTESTPECANCKKGSKEEYAFFRSHIIDSFSVLDHIVGTCSMLPLADGGVVDSQFRLYGTRNVRVVDASVIPTQVSAHTQATVYALAEKAADVILGSK